MRLILVLLIVVASVLAGPSRDVSERIHGGSLTTIDQYPYAAAIIFEFFPNSWGQNCGGAILNEKSILSAAHCYTDDKADPRKIRVRVGSTFASSGGQVHNAVQLINHPQYNPNTMNNDVAVVHLATFMQFNNLVQQAQIAGPNYHLPENDVVVSVGWGLTSAGQRSEQLRQVSQRVVSRQQCQGSFFITITDSMLCIGSNLNEGICIGDSGGPNMHNNVIVGVTSFGGVACGMAGSPDVLARVSSYNSWILANVFGN